jgi:large subunit ribosomal protein L32
MGLPGHRRTSSHKRRRASHFALKPKTLATCPKCQAPVLPHIACKECGTYAGRQVIELKNPLEKKAAPKKDAAAKKATKKAAKPAAKKKAAKAKKK